MIIHRRVRARRHPNIVFIVVVFQELFLNHEEAFQSHLDLWLMLGTASSQLSEVIGGLREVFEPDSQFDLLVKGALLFHRGCSLGLIRDLF